jgi:hypothetical protein
MRRLFAALLGGLALMSIGTAVAAAVDGPVIGPVIGPEPAPVLCALAIEPPPAQPGELPALENPVSASTDAWGCDPRAEGRIKSRAGGFALMADAKIALATIRSEAAFTTDVNGVPQVRINPTLAGKNGAQARGAAVRYEVTVTIPANPPAQPQPRVIMKTVEVAVGTLQNDGSIGGTNLTAFAAGEIPAGATVDVKLVAGSVSVAIGNVVVTATADQENLPQLKK